MASTGDGGGDVACQAIRTRSLVRIADIETAPELSDLDPEARANLRAVVLEVWWRCRCDGRPT